MSQSTSFSCISWQSLPWLAAVAAALSVVVAFVAALVVVVGGGVVFVVAVFGDPYRLKGLLQLTKRAVSQIFGAGGFGFGGFAWWVLFGF